MARRRGSLSTISPMSRVRVPQHVVRLVAPLVVDYFTYAGVWVPLHIARLVVDYFAYTAHPGASTRPAVRCVARRRLLLLHRASGCFGTSRCSSRGLSSRLVVNYFPYAMRPGALACRAAHRAACHRLLRLRRTSGCLGTSRGSSCGCSSTTSPMTCVRVPQHVVRLITPLVVDSFAYAARSVPRHVARLVTPLVVDYFAYAACPRVSACRTARHAARCRLLHPRPTSGCLGTSRGSSSTTSPTPRVRWLRRVTQLIAPLFVDYFAYAAHPDALARHAAPRAAHRWPSTISPPDFPSPRCTGSTAPTSCTWTAISPLDFSSVGCTGSRHVPYHSVSRLYYSVRDRHDFVLRPHWLFLSRGNTGSISSTPHAGATMSSGRIASTTHLD
jgi:hypothetical protein